MNDDVVDDVGTDSEARDHVPPVADPPSPTNSSPGAGLRERLERRERADGGRTGERCAFFPRL